MIYKVLEVMIQSEKQLYALIKGMVKEAMVERGLIRESDGMDDVKGILGNFLKQMNDREKHQKSKPQKERPKMRSRKKSHGATEYYDYDDYLRKNRKLAVGDVDSLIDGVDQEKTNIAAVARDLFPDHTDEGAQSQLRKILNHERPLTKPVAEKLAKMISTGQIVMQH